MSEKKIYSGRIGIFTDITGEWGDGVVYEIDGLFYALGQMTPMYEQQIRTFTWSAYEAQPIPRQHLNFCYSHGRVLSPPTTPSDYVDTAYDHMTEGQRQHMANKLWKHNYRSPKAGFGKVIEVNGKDYRLIEEGV